MPTKLETFALHREHSHKVEFIESNEVFPGVVCDVYNYPETGERDLAVISIAARHRTHPQMVLNGEQTIEGYVSGSGRLIIKKSSGERLVFEVGEESEGFAQMVEVGDTMQWQADDELVVFEVCYPPYQEGRYKNLENIGL